MKRIGIIDFDTSHVVAFVSRLNHVGVEESQWVDGARVVVGCPGKSIIFPERIAEETAKVKKLGLELVESPEAMLRYNLDAVFIESNSGMQHLERARFFLQHKLPLFIDKPFACSAADAEAMVGLANAAGVPICSCSSLRFAPEVVSARRSHSAPSSILGCLSYGPAPTHEKNPGLFHYGIHAVEVLVAVLGTGCEWVTNVASRHADVVTGHWKDGRIGTVRGQRPSSGYGFVIWTEKQATHHAINTQFIYRDLLKAIVGMLETGEPPAPPAEMIEIVRFIEQAAVSAANHGNPRMLESTATSAPPTGSSTRRPGPRAARRRRALGGE
jgi:predicted dehydrogenase